MNAWRLTAICAAAMFAAALIPQANASEWNDKTIVTFNQPVEIPGQVLPAGTYSFQLMDTLADRNIVQVFNKDGTHLFATILAIPDYRLHPTGKTVIRFEERAAGAPEAIKAWFYPGDRYGQEFVYPRARATELAKASNEAVPSMEENMTASTKMPVKSPKEAPAEALSKTPLKAMSPSGQEEEMAQAIPPPTPAQKPAPEPTTAQNTMAQNTMAQNRMPETASSLPLFALIGFLALASGAAIRFGVRRAG